MSYVHVGRSRKQRGGFIVPALLGAHSVLQSIKPITTGVNIAKSLGVADKINSALDSNRFGRAVKSVGSFLQSSLGYGRRRPRRPRRKSGGGRKRRVGRPRKH